MWDVDRGRFWAERRANTERPEYGWGVGGRTRRSK